MGITKHVWWEEAREERRRQRIERKKKAILMHNKGHSVEEIAATLRVSSSTVKTYLREWEREGKPDVSKDPRYDTESYIGPALLLLFIGLIGSGKVVESFGSDIGGWINLIMFGLWLFGLFDEYFLGVVFGGAILLFIITILHVPPTFAFVTFIIYVSFL